MGHNILEGMFAAKQSAWHNLGVVDSSFSSAVDAVKAANMDYKIHKLPLSIVTPEGVTVPFESFGLLRGPTVESNEYVPLGTCGRDYTYFQNSEIAEKIDRLTDETGWKFSTAGALGNGETIFICLDVGATSIAGEDIDKYFTYTETRDGKTVARAYVSRIRTVCQNTLNLGLKQASSKISLRHYSEYKEDAQWIMGMLSEAERTGQAIDQALADLADIQINSDQFHEMVQAVAPEPTMPNMLLMLNAKGRTKEKQERAEYVYNQKLRKVQMTRSAIIENYKLENV